MIAILPVRFTSNTDPNSTWSAQHFHNWMHLSVPFSLGNFWWMSGWAGLDLNYELFPELVIADPRLASGSGTEREKLVNGCIDKAPAHFRASGRTTAFDDYDILFLWFAQHTDMFGGGSFTVPLSNGRTKQIPVTVADVDSWYSGCCQELGHSFGFDHEVSQAGDEYASPYSSMSARGMFEFIRSGDNRLPDGNFVTDPGDPQIGQRAQRIIGPSMTAAQLFGRPWFRNSLHVARATFDGARRTGIFKLFAHDFARDRREQGLLVLLVVPGIAERRFGLELRRQVGFDQAVTPAVTVHSFPVDHLENVTGRIVYEGAALLNAYPAFDFPVYAGPFSLRILEVASDHSFVVLQAFQGTWGLLDKNPNTVDIVADGSHLYQLHRARLIWKYVGTPQWQLLDANSATVKIAASAGNLYQLHRGGMIWKYVGTPQWQELDRNSDSVDIVADGGELYQLHVSGKVWRYAGTPGQWIELDANPETIKIAASGGNLYQLHRNGKIWKYVGTPHWVLLDNNPASTEIVADGSDLYQMHHDGKIWKYVGTPQWQLLDSNPATTQIAASGGLLFQLHRTGHIWRFAGVRQDGVADWFDIDHNPASKKIEVGNHVLYQLHDTGAIFAMIV